MCKAHSKVTHIKQQKYFHHLKGHRYNKNYLQNLYGVTFLLHWVDNILRRMWTVKIMFLRKLPLEQVNIMVYYVICCKAVIMMCWRRPGFGERGCDGRRGVFRSSPWSAAADRAELVDVQLGTRPPALLIAATYYLHAVRRPLWHAGRAVLSAGRLQVSSLARRCQLTVSFRLINIVDRIWLTASIKSFFFISISNQNSTFCVEMGECSGCSPGIKISHFRMTSSCW